MHEVHSQQGGHGQARHGKSNEHHGVSIDLGNRDTLYSSESSLVKQSISEGKKASESGQFGTFFHSIHQLQIGDHPNSAKLDSDLGHVNAALKSRGLSVSIDPHFNDQIHLKENEPGKSPVSLTAAEFSAGHGRDAQVIMNARNEVIKGGITYYKQASDGRETKLAAGSIKGLPPEAMFEETDITTRSGLKSAMQRLDVMHSLGIRTVAVAVDEADPQYLQEYAQHGASLHPPMNFIWNLSGNDPSGKLVWENMDSSTASGVFEKYRDAYELQYNTNKAPDNATLLKYIIDGPLVGSYDNKPAVPLSKLPGTVGYYAADDSNIPSSQSTGVAKVNSYLKQLRSLDPNSAHEIYVGAYGARQRDLYQKDLDRSGSVIMEEYPLGGLKNNSFNNLNARGEPDASTNPQSFYSGDTPAGVKSSIEATAKGAQDHHEGTNLALQAFNWTPGSKSIGYPTYADQVGLRNMTLSHSQSQNIFWYWLPGTLGNPGESNAPRGSQSTEYTARLAAAINAPLPDTRYWNT